MVIRVLHTPSRVGSVQTMYIIMLILVVIALSGHHTYCFVIILMVIRVHNTYFSVGSV